MLKEPEVETASDHRVLEWIWKGEVGERVAGDWKAKGWALREALDKKLEEAKSKRGEGKTGGETLEQMWRKLTGADRRREREGGETRERRETRLILSVTGSRGEDGQQSG